ncbi:hypothetical protein chiPu_0030540 [Chiloscyllium punctatum]|uniref:Uncharacterized protein n=1 Tax=Chiloscyllium punctatum TaxID=137246 RepID=A0A401TV03_CHIPU|nr:hypothetical protein [Chiloscyllium punctatum]
MASPAVLNHPLTPGNYWIPTVSSTVRPESPRPPSGITPGFLSGMTPGFPPNPRLLPVSHPNPGFPSTLSGYVSASHRLGAVWNGFWDSRRLCRSESQTLSPPPTCRRSRFSATSCQISPERGRERRSHSVTCPESGAAVFPRESVPFPPRELGHVGNGAQYVRERARPALDCQTHPGNSASFSSGSYT